MCAVAFLWPVKDGRVGLSSVSLLVKHSLSLSLNLAVVCGTRIYMYMHAPFLLYTFVIEWS